MLQILPPAAYLLAVVGMLATLRSQTAGPSAWIWPAMAGGAFVAFSVVTVAAEGVLIFWTNHTANLAGNQVWFDLLSAVVVAAHLIAPRARAVGMNLGLWVLAVILTASMALLPMLARLLWLERNRAAQSR